jgi:hypothetical protein
MLQFTFIQAEFPKMLKYGIIPQHVVMFVLMAMLS